jgi:hypothetical protein
MSEAGEVNGSVPPDDPIIEGLRSRIEVKETDVRRLKASLTKLEMDLKQDQKALAILRGEKLGAGGRPPASANKPARVREKPSGVSEERLELVRGAITQLDTDEFRQVDVRGIMDITSSATAMAFETLRQRGVIRFARQDGNNKWYRLTREELARQAPKS